METIKANQVLANINERRAVREYTVRPVDGQIIETLLEAGRMAPSAINKQPWKFHIVTDVETIKRFSKEIEKVAEGHFQLSIINYQLSIEDPIFHGAPVVIFISALKDNDWAPIDIGMCAENIMLAAKSMGLDSCPVGMAKFIEQTPCYSELKIPSTEHIVISIVIGYGNEKPALHTRIRNNAFYI